MNTLLQDIEDFLLSNGVCQAGSLFRDTMPNDPDDCVALYEYGGALPAQQVAGAMRRVQVSVRGTNASATVTKARQVYNALDTDDGIKYFTSERWAVIKLMQTPIKIKVDEAHRLYYGFNISITTYLD